MQPLPIPLREELYEALEEPYLRRLQISRRQFLQITAAGVIAVALAGCTVLEEILELIANRRVRRDVNALPAGDTSLDTYAAAVAAMKALPASDNRNWENQSRIHNDHCPHGNWLFLPWHREYLYRFEEICREVTGDTAFALPYWHWQKDRAVPAPFFDASSPLFDATRNPDPARTLGDSAVGPLVIDQILMEGNFLNFASKPIAASDPQRTPRSERIYHQLEGTPHNSVHPFVGCLTSTNCPGNMAGFNSPRDPIFWLHHNMVEAIWVEWNLRRGHPNTNDSAWTDRQFTEFYDRSGTPVTVDVQTGLLYPLFTYRYDDPVLGSP